MVSRRKHLLFFCLGLSVALFFIYLLAVTDLGSVIFGWPSEIYSPSLSMNDRWLYTRGLGLTRLALLEDQEKSGSLPTMPNSEFQDKYVGHPSGGSNPEMRVEYANDLSLRFAMDQPERAIVVLKVISGNERSIHILTTKSCVVQTVGFDEVIWDTNIAGLPIPYENMEWFVWTNLNKVKLDVNIGTEKPVKKASPNSS